jgi:alkyl sulfatase BDS1-like metallo-beta-lactamase superfamily hydrolase
VSSEIAETLTLPPEFVTESHTTGYYGHLVHNVKAIHQRYLSWYDGNPARLHQHPPVQAGRRYVQLAGGAQALLAAARRSFDEGDYRWVVEVVNHLVFADPANQDARSLQADALEQLGYQSESATFRNAYLTGAQELRHGSPVQRPAGRRGLVHALPIDQLFDTLGVRLLADDVAGVDISIDCSFTDIDERWLLGLSNRAIHYRRDRSEPAADRVVDAHVTTTRETLLAIAAGEVELDAAHAAGDMAITGDVSALHQIFDHLDVFTSGFAIIEP